MQLEPTAERSANPAVWFARFLSTHIKGKPKQKGFSLHL